MKPEEAREQLLNKIDLALCRIYPGNINAHEQLRDFYNYISELSLNHLVINWYITNKGKIDIEVIDDEVRVIKTDDQGTEQHNDEIVIPNIHDDLIRRVFDNKN